MKKLKETITSSNGKKYIYLLCIAILLFWVIFRFSAIGAEKSLNVFNATRISNQFGVPVDVIEVYKTDGVIKEPIGIENNRAYVSSARVGNLYVGQKIGDGVIVSVSPRIDLNTGMHIIKTKGTDDGLQYAEFTANGYFIPAYAVKDNEVFVAEKGVAVPRHVTVARQDSENAFISDGLNDGDKVILSKVGNGDKVQIK